ncbi:MAG: transketolase [Planctomycetes bacterium]|nr:transketolase [Planctomycetota bacterium]
MSSPSSSASPQLEQLAVNTIRVLCMEAVQKAKSGHPGLPMGCADFAYVLFAKFLKFNPRNPRWPDRDRFILSAGHGSMLLYTMLHLCGYDLPLEQLGQFRQWGSMTPGHPEYGEAPGVEMTTGPLGQGFATGVGMALAERMLAARYNAPEFEIVDHHTYALVSDGDLMEGISHEAASLAGHLKLGKLIYFYDDNHITIEGDTSLAFSEDIARRFESYGWHVQKIDGQDRQAIEGALHSARRETGRPSLIIGRTTIAYGSPNKAGTHDAHGSPLGPEEVQATRENLGWSHPELTVPEEVLPLFRAAAEEGARRNKAWDDLFERFEGHHRKKAQDWRRIHEGKLPETWESALPRFSSADKPVATRSASGQVINALAKALPELIGGSADLAPSNNTMVKGEGSVSAQDFSGRNLHFGVREHAMGAALNGLALHGGLRPYGGTFLVFSDYMRPSIRLAALTGAPVTYVFTHDSIFVGEDGPTHQPIEHAAALRAIPNLRVIRPADANETAAAWAMALEHTKGPTALLLTRQNLPIYEDTIHGGGAEKGGYILVKEAGGPPDIILIATGSEVSICREAAKGLKLKSVKARVVSLPSWEVFDAQPEEYRHKVLPPGVKRRLAVEAASPFGWERYVGLEGKIIGLSRFGASAPYGVLAEKFGFTAENVLQAALTMLGK